MKLLLDEMLPATIAEELRVGGHDVAAIGERRDLWGLRDADVFAHAQREQRAVVTYDRKDYLALDRRCREEGREHHGIVILHPRRFPQRAAGTPALVRSLAALMAAGPPYPGFVLWLR